MPSETVSKHSEIQKMCAQMFVMFIMLIFTIWHVITCSNICFPGCFALIFGFLGDRGESKYAEESESNDVGMG